MINTHNTPALRADLRQFPATQTIREPEPFDVVLSRPFCLAESIGAQLCVLEEGGVDFGDSVGACARDDVPYYPERCPVSAQVAADGYDFAVGMGEGEEESEGGEDEGWEHGCGERQMNGRRESGVRVFLNRVYLLMKERQ